MKILSGKWLPGAAGLLAISAIAAPPGPTPVIPEGGQGPGPYPNTSISSGNWVAKGGDADEGNVEMNLEENGPIPWSIVRYNRGDFALKLSPRDPVAARTNLAQGFIQFDNGTAADAVGQAWSPNHERGVVIPTVRQNGPITWPDSQGAFFPTIAMSSGSSGNGYNMITGAFPSGDLDINTGKAGAASEANFNFAATWFPYDQGWLGGNVAGPSPEGASTWVSPGSHAAGLAAGMVKWLDYPAESAVFGGRARLTLPGVNSLTDGMIFAASSDGASDVNIVGVAPLADGTGWDIAIREDSATDAETLAADTQSEFEYVYVPYNAQGLTGGYINGADGAKIQAKGDFTVSRTGAGVYELTIPGKTGASGALLLQAADFEAGTAEPLASRAFLSYEFANGKFVIQARKTTSDTAADSADVSFYVAFVDFAQPMQAPAGPRFRATGPVRVSADTEASKEISVAASADQPELLVTYIDANNANGYPDGITGQTATGILIGRFYDAKTLQPTSDEFPIVGNPSGVLTKVDTKYNPVSKQYVTISLARGYSAGGLDTPLIALINPASVAGANSPVAKAFAHDPDSTESYDDVSIAVSSKNGNFLIVPERKFTGEGEGVVAALYSQTGTLLTAPFTRLDLLQQIGDEDDPDVIYIPELDKFLYTGNTDNSNGSTGTLANRVVGALIDPAPDAQGGLVTRTEQPLGNGEPAGQAEGHPASIFNPFNGQIITAYDAGNGTSIGDLSYQTVGPAPGFTFSEASAEVPYLSGEPGNPFRHQHPQLALDRNSKVFLLGMNARESIVGLPDGYAFWLLGEDGKPVAGQLKVPYYLSDAPGAIDNGVNFHSLRYSPAADAFIVAYSTTPGVAYLVSLELTSDAGGGTGGETPRLAVSRTADNIVIAWDASATGFTLESTAALGSAANWQPAAATPVTESNQLKVTIPTNGKAAFYRLKK